ncbi:MAG: dihydrolipoamide acetyltransferase family protein [Myxococcota bacterium]
MAKLVEMPKLSPTMEEGQIAAWHVREGDTIDVDDLLAEVETDKATMEFRSFDRGVLLKILSGDGAIVRLGDPVAIIGEAGEDIAPLVAAARSGGGDVAVAVPDALSSTSPPSPPAPDAPATSGAAPSGRRPPPAAEAARDASAAPVAASVDATGRVKASPYVRKLAREKDLDLRTVAGTGPGGRIIARDVEALPAAPTPPAAAATTAAGVPLPRALPHAGRGHPARSNGVEPPEIVPLTMMRKTIARRLTESKQTVPHFYLTIDVDAGPLFDLRRRLNADLADLDPPQKVSFNDFVIKAVAVAITRAPAVNATFTETALVYHRRVDISVAVAVDDGLVTPVVRDADRKSLLAINAEVADLAARARAKRLTPEEMSDGTFSVSNLGMFGIDAFAAVINPPEGAILAVGGIRSEPVVVADAVVPGRRMSMTLSCDHRVVDGAVGATFLAELRRLLEHPTQILAF